MTKKIEADIRFKENGSVEVTTTKTEVQTQAYTSYDHLARELGSNRFWNRLMGMFGGTMAVGGTTAEIISFGQLLVDHGVNTYSAGDAAMDQVWKVGVTAVGVWLFINEKKFSLGLKVVEAKKNEIAEQIPNITRIQTL